MRLSGFICFADFAVTVFPVGFACLRLTGLPRRKKIRQRPDLLKTGGVFPLNENSPLGLQDEIPILLPSQINCY